MPLGDLQSTKQFRRSLVFRFRGLGFRGLGLGLGFRVQGVRI